MVARGVRTLVVVPGLGLADPVYADLAAALPARAVTVVRLPGYGEPAGSAPLTPPALARRLLAELDARGIGEVTLLGHSSSCQVVAEAAAAAPDRVRALVLIGPTTDPRARTWPRLVRRWLATARHERLGQVPLLVRVYARTGLASMARAMDCSRRHDLLAAVERVRSPLLVVRGRHDVIAPADWTAQVATTGAGTALTLPAGAHMVPITHAGPLAGALGDWLAGAGAGSGVRPG